MSRAPADRSVDPRQAPAAAVLGHRFGKGLQLQLDLLQRVEGPRDHPVEQIGSEVFGQRDSLLVSRQQVVAGHHDTDLDGSQAVRRLVGCLRFDIAMGREDDGVSVGVGPP